MKSQAFFRGVGALALASLLLITGCQSVSNPHSLNPNRSAFASPDGRIQVQVQTSGALTYTVTVDGQPLINASRLGLALRPGLQLGQQVECRQATGQRVDNSWENPWGKRRHVRDRYTELRLSLVEASAGGRPFEVIFRAYNDGVAFRYVLPWQAGREEVVVERELTEFAFTGDHACFLGQHETGFKGSQEWQFQPKRLADIQPASVVGLPLLIQTSAAWVALLESDLRDWPGMWLGGADAPGKLGAKLPPRQDGQGVAKVAAPHTTPWRVLMIGRQPGQLIESDLVLNLATPCVLADTSFVRPGKMAWDHWWSGDVQMNTATLKEYIQLAADMGWPYQLVDWQWYGEFNKPTSDITKPNPAVDMDEVRRFAREKGVKLWVWLYWTDADRNDAYEKAFALYEQWGIAGVKIDFMDSDHQEMVNWYEKITRAAAQHHLMVNFHGAFKTSGFNRTYPNQITREGILGNEYNRWSKLVTPEHKVTLPFTRFLAGPADYTPGGFLNRQPGQFKPDEKAAQVQGTRAAELALFVVYDSPLCCVCDHPSHYRGQPGIDFLQVVPTVWDDTKVLQGEVASHLVMARRSGEDWFLGALTASTARTVEVKLDFLGRGRWKARLWQDAADSNVNAEHLDIVERSVTRGDTLTLKLAPAGGCAVRFTRE